MNRKTHTCFIYMEEKQLLRRHLLLVLRESTLKHRGAHGRTMGGVVVMRQSVGAYTALHFELFGSQTKGRDAVLPRRHNEGQTQVSWNFEETSQLFMNKTGEKDSFTETGIIKKNETNSIQAA